MTSLTDDLQLAHTWAKTTYPNTPSEIVGEQVYINFGYREAVCIGVEYTEDGKTWYATATAWDVTGGVSDEHEIIAGNLTGVTDAVARFLMNEAVQEEKLERLLAQRPEDL